MPKTLKHVLVVANQTATSPVLLAELRHRAQRGPVTFSLLVPILNSRLRHWLSDIDEAHSTAVACAEHTQAVMAKHGLPMRVQVADSVPLQAIADELSRFPADELIIATLPVARSHWLERDMSRQVRQRFELPVLHVVSAATGSMPAVARPPGPEGTRTADRPQSAGRLRSASRLVSRAVNSS
jgi:hypothetical protein